MLEMTSDAPTNAGKHVTSNTAGARSQRYTKYSVIWLAKMALRLMMLRNFPPYVGPNVISYGPSNGLSIHQLSN